MSVGRTTRGELVGPVPPDEELTAARAAHEAGRLDVFGVKRVEDLAIDRLVRVQAEAALPTVTDGYLRMVGDAGSVVEQFVYLRARARGLARVHVPSPALYAPGWSDDGDLDASDHLQAVVEALREGIDEVVGLGATCIELFGPPWLGAQDPAQAEFLDRVGWPGEAWRQAAQDLANAVMAGFDGVTFLFDLGRVDAAANPDWSATAAKLMAGTTAHRVALEVPEGLPLDCLEALPEDRELSLVVVGPRPHGALHERRAADRLDDAARFHPVEQIVPAASWRASDDQPDLAEPLRRLAEVARLWQERHPDVFGSEEKASDPTSGRPAAWAAAPAEPPGLSLVARLTAPGVNQLRFSPDGTMAAALTKERGVLLWDCETWEPIGELWTQTGDESFPTRAKAFSWAPDSRRMATYEERILIWDVTTREVTERFRTKWGSGERLAWCPTDDRIAVQGNELEIYRGGERLARNKGGGDYVEWSPNGGRIATEQGVFDAETLERQGSFEEKAQPFGRICWTPDGLRVLFASNRPVIADPDTGRTLSRLEPARDVEDRHDIGFVNSVAASADGAWAACQSTLGMVTVFRTDTWACVAQLDPAITSSRTWVAFHPTEPLLATRGEKDGAFHLWRLDADELLRDSPWSDRYSLVGSHTDDGVTDTFMCHTSGDKPAVRELTRKLRLLGVRCWSDEDVIIAGDAWQGALEHQLNTARTVIVCLGRDTMGEWQRQEIEGFVAQGRSRPVRIIPVLVRKGAHVSNLPEELKGISAVDITTEGDAGVERLAAAILKERPS